MPPPTIRESAPPTHLRRADALQRRLSDARDPAAIREQHAGVMSSAALLQQHHTPTRTHASATQAAQAQLTSTPRAPPCSLPPAPPPSLQQPPIRHVLRLGNVSKVRKFNTCRLEICPRELHGRIGPPPRPRYSAVKMRHPQSCAMRNARHGGPHPVCSTTSLPDLRVLRYLPDYD